VMGLLTARDKIVLAGSFSYRSRVDLVAVDSQTGRVDEGWGPRIRPGSSPSSSGEITAVATTRRVIYAVGAFQGGGVPPGFLATSRKSGRPITGFRPPKPQRPREQLLALAAGGAHVFVAGSFDSLGRTPRNGLARLSGRTGRVDTWAPRCSCSRFGYLALAGTRLYVAAGFGRLRAIDARTGSEVRTWRPRRVGLIAASGSRLLVVSQSAPT
jgi:hypothetical protein